ncbi:DUF3108 domain-containing protein [Piscinibacter sakaiensis]|uniref:DUF3108 domain-containing protein n=1 Tax=Piscinibacter sakaiensis TaxID=1547922 RepID=A0A0K8NYN6_PISS1|nr:DUF3108 domain-containing protein [Piscinibacter sakaiensis]GAP35035.1 hypothetical protein ISF6_0600 [Piscinibacter sakaiensis]
MPTGDAADAPAPGRPPRPRRRGLAAAALGALALHALLLAGLPLAAWGRGAALQAAAPGVAAVQWLPGPAGVPAQAGTPPPYEPAGPVVDAGRPAGYAGQLAPARSEDTALPPQPVPPRQPVPPPRQARPGGRPATATATATAGPAPAPPAAAPATEPMAASASEPAPASASDPAPAAPSDPAPSSASDPVPPAPGVWRLAARDDAAPPPAAASGPPGAATFEGEDIPVYATRVAPSQTLRYQVRRGMVSGTGVLTWRVDAPARAGARYEAQLEASAIGLTLMTQRSEGTLDAAGLAPQRFTDRRLRGSTRAANFQRERGVISYSGPSVEHPLLPGAQDRLSWMLQLPAILEANPRLARPGARVVIYLVGARGDAAVWTFRSLGPEAVATPGGSVAAVKLVREPRKPHDTQAEVWLDPARQHLPVRAKLGNPPDGDELELLRLPG